MENPIRNTNRIKEKEYYKQKFKHNPILKWFFTITNTKIRILVYPFLLKIDKTIYNRIVPEIPKNPHNATKITAQTTNI